MLSDSKLVLSFILDRLLWGTILKPMAYKIVPNSSSCDIFSKMSMSTRTGSSFLVNTRYGGRLLKDHSEICFMAQFPFLGVLLMI